METFIEACGHVNSLALTSASKHAAMILLVRQYAGEDVWPGIEALAIDTSIPRAVLERAVQVLRQRGILRVVREGDGYAFKVKEEVLRRLAAL